MCNSHTLYVWFNEILSNLPFWFELYNASWIRVLMYVKLVGNEVISQFLHPLSQTCMYMYHMCAHQVCNIFYYCYYMVLTTSFNLRKKERDLVVNVFISKLVYLRRIWEGNINHHRGFIGFLLFVFYLLSFSIIIRYIIWSSSN